MQTATPLLLALLGATAPATPTPRVAVVYSAFSGYSFRSEYEAPLSALGWRYEGFENTAAAQLAARLKDFDLVISASTGNYESPQDMAAFRAQWLAYLEGGGVLLVTDASYPSVLSMWVNTLGDAYQLASAVCAAASKQNPEARAVTVDGGPLMTVPNDLAPLLRARENLWAHLDSWPEGWQSHVTCRDGKSLWLTRRVGRGLLVATSYYSLKDPQGQALARAMLENLALYAQAARHDLEVTRLHLGELAPGETKVRLGIRHVGEGPRELKVGVQAEMPGAAAKMPALVPARVTPAEEARLELPLRVAARGQQIIRVVVTDESGRALLDWPTPVEIPPPVRVTLRRWHLYPGQSRLEAEVCLLPDLGTEVEGLRLEYRIDDRRAGSCAASGRALPLSLPVGRLQRGEHTLRVSLRAGGREVGAATERFFRHDSPRVALRGDGVTLVEGKPFFPFGFYHVSQSRPLPHRLEMLRDLAAAGFNAAHARAMEVNEYGSFLDECAKAGVYVVTEFTAPPLEVIARYRSHPAVLGWDPGDEPDLWGISPAKMTASYDQFKQLDPDHPVYTVVANPVAYAAYARGTDILAPDPYPIPNAPVSMVYDSLSRARREASRWGTALWGILQAFAWEKSRAPTPAEIRAMTYLALLAGAKGILYYTYADGTWVLPEHPEQWDALKALVPEMRRIAPAVMDGRFSLLSEGRDGLYAGVWSHRGERLVVVVNSAPKQRSFDLPLRARSAELLFRDGPAPSVRGGRIRGDIDGLETVVLRASR